MHFYFTVDEDLIFQSRPSERRPHLRLSRASPLPSLLRGPGKVQWIGRRENLPSGKLTSLWKITIFDG